TVNDSAASASRSFSLAKTPEARTDHCVISPSTHTSPRRSICVLIPPDTLATENGVSGEEPFGSAPDVMPPRLCQSGDAYDGGVITNGQSTALAPPPMPTRRAELADRPVLRDGVPVRKRVLLAAPRGYCAGVDRAVIAVEKALDHYGAPVYV